MTGQLIKIIFRDRKLFAASFLIIAGTIFIGYYFFKKQVKSKSDLREFKAEVNDFSFSENKGLKTHTYTYYLYLKGYNCRFQIIADFAEYCFDKDYFESKIRLGDTITVEIPQNDFERIGKLDKVMLFGIKDSKTSYLDDNATIERYNSKLTLQGGLFCIALGLLIFYFNSEKLNQTEGKLPITNRLKEI